MSNLNKLYSPLSGSSEISKIQVIKLNWLKNMYAEKFGFDINIKKKEDNCSLYLDNLTGYKFFYPFELAGSVEFYKHMAKFGWYYNHEKWEFEYALANLSTNDKVLEIGCGNGSFLSKLESKSIVNYGIETDISLVQKEFQNRVFVDSIENFSIKHKEEFSACCFFQVLEHIVQVESFISSAISVLKKGGLLIISVPNNDGYLKYLEDEILNYPPHHMGRWNKASLTSLEKIFNIKLIRLVEEPLQNDQINSFLWSLEYRFIFKWLVKNSIIRRILRKLIRVFRYWIKGHTIMAIYRKTD